MSQRPWRALTRALLLSCALSLSCAGSTLPDQDLNERGEGGVGAPLGGATPPTGGEAPPPAGAQAEPPPIDPARADLALIVTAPPRGARLMGAQTRLEGEVRGGAAPMVTVNGQAAAVGADGRFSATVALTPGLNTLVTELRDGDERREDRRAALVDASADPAVALSDALTFQLTRGGFADISGALTRYVSGLNLASLGGALAQQGVTIHALQHGPLSIQINPEGECVNLILSTIGPEYINGLRHGDDCITVAGGVLNVMIALSGVFEGNAISGTVFLYGAQLLLFLVPQVSADGGVSMRIVNPLVTINGEPVISVDGLPDFLFELFGGLIKELMEQVIRDALSNVALPALFDPSALTQRLDLLGKPVDLSLKFTALDLTHEAMTAQMSARVAAAAPSRQGGTLPPTPGVPLMTAQHTPNAPRDLDAALSSDLIGRSMHAAWSAGALDLNLNDLAGDAPLPLTVALLANALGDAAAGVERTAPLLMSTRDMLPPIARVEGGERPLKISVGDLLLDLATAADGPLATVALHLDTEVGINIAPNPMTGALELTPDIAVTAAHADVAETPRGAVNEASLEQLIGTFMRSIPALAAAPIPLDPAAPGMGMGMGGVVDIPIELRGGELEADEGAPFLHFLGDLAQTP